MRSAAAGKVNVLLGEGHIRVQVKRRGTRRPRGVREFQACQCPAVVTRAQRHRRSEHSLELSDDVRTDIVERSERAPPVERAWARSAHARRSPLQLTTCQLFVSHVLDPVPTSGVEETGEKNAPVNAALIEQQRQLARIARRQRHGLLQEQMLPLLGGDHRVGDLCRWRHSKIDYLSCLKQFREVAEGPNARRRSDECCLRSIAGPHPDHVESRVVEEARKMHRLGPSAGPDECYPNHKATNRLIPMCVIYNMQVGRPARQR